MRVDARVPMPVRLERRYHPQHFAHHRLAMEQTRPRPEHPGHRTIDIVILVLTEDVVGQTVQGIDNLIEKLDRRMSVLFANTVEASVILAAHGCGSLSYERPSISTTASGM